MNNIMPFLKKHLVSALLIFAVAILGVSNYSLQNKVNNDSNKVLAFEEGILSGESTENSNEESTQLALTGGGNQFPPSSLPHPNCVMDLVHGYETSDEYNPNTDYNLSFFVGGQSGFQDVNGDNLVDYVYTSTTYGGSTQSIYAGCVYLNNGSGWTKAHACYANTITDPQGNIETREYRGDCAASN